MRLWLSSLRPSRCSRHSPCSFHLWLRFRSSHCCCHVVPGLLHMCSHLLTVFVVYLMSFNNSRLHKYWEIYYENESLRVRQLWSPILGYERLTY